jgi:heptosyltransferase I
MTPIDFPTPPLRILLIKPSAIGDVVHTLPILGLLRKRWPAAHISWLLTPACAGLLEGHPLLNEVIVFERRRFGRWWRSPAWSWRLLHFARGLRRKKFDLVIDLQGLFRSGILSWLTRAPVRVGFANAREFAPMFYNRRVPIETNDQHAIDRYLKVAAALGCDVGGPIEFPFHVTDEDRREVASLVGGADRYAVLLPGTNWATKRWPVEHYAALVRPLRERFNLWTVVAGSDDEAALGAAVAGGINLAGKTSLRQLAALIERATVVIANDSGPMHIAAGMGKPLVTLFGPTSPLRTGPYRRESSVLRIDLPCSPCYSRKCSHQTCLQWIDIEPVMRMAEEQIARVGRR